MDQVRIGYRSTRFDETWRFYIEALGAEVITSWTDHGRGVVVRLAGTACIEVFEAEQADIPNVMVAAQVDDVGHWADRLDTAGVQLSQPLIDQPWGHRSLSFIDPNGLIVTLFEVVAAEESTR
jgi:catechol 2,3-dioxygenase-like lactoylglutathione lyase family enzyme